MSSKLLLSIKDALVSFDKTPLFNGLSFNIHEGARIALVGKNGAGKSTLMNLITGHRELDAGERWEENNITIGYLHQDIIPKEEETVFDYIFSEIKDEDKELYSYKVDIVTDALQIDPKALMTVLSGGQLRRAGIARALVEEPDILLLDEPTNHLDLEIIQWLENYLRNYRGTILCVSHDRTFLSNITNQVFWLDRGKMKVSPKGFAHFEEWSSLLLEQEERELKNRKQMVAQEIEWANRGVKARRKRNVRRVEQMKIMRDQLKADQSSYRRATQKIELTPLKDTEENAKIVAEFYNVSKSFKTDEGVIPILDKFNLRIQRGDRIGILGRNGSGKTTFLKLLIDDLQPDSGRIKRKKELEFSYFDQKRKDLKPDSTLKKILSPTGNDYINVMGKERHVCGYIKDFMFDPARIEDKVCNLSGGQKNRLMLAKILASPKSCLILDEPTNDLDMETLDMLEEIISQYKGTLIVVSHDRDFLDQTVTQIIAFEGDTKIDRCIGGYSDYLAQKQKEAKPKKEKKNKPKKSTRIIEEVNKENKPKKEKKLSYKLEYELKELPNKIEKLTAEINEHNTKLRDPDFYQKDPNEFHNVTKALSDAQAKLDRYETRWLELSEMKSA